ncbi:hypothetical protein [Mycobacterium talmoniae]|uniref:DUF4878 domain-containing protein n=1 Tax=Mycobacterium talmoniae TaxID=1858794 RepID=A0A1S1NHN0_9MYCO|nr:MULTISPECIES: hypothetical protein [Mycobacterium]OHV03090.1 hypothetical protein BKN37_15280 [Mycobacterium talmoniae]PQM48546.1 hypothetical protein C1Y40_01236 [Mycobacterium talmoniae]TDH56894.1 hypothetical protein E2F47_04520 [Mycobacterium eburneum]
MLTCAVSMSGPLAWSPARADPAAPPTLESIEPPPPPPRPAASNTSDEAQIRQVFLASIDAYNRSDWNTWLGNQCARLRHVNTAVLQGIRDRGGPNYATIMSVTVMGNTADVTQTDQLGQVDTFHMVRENGWKICGAA